MRVLVVLVLLWIELLVVIAIIAVLSVVVILTLNPAELLRQSRDANRTSDAATLKSALGVYSEDVGGNMGSSSVVYVSIPDLSATSTMPATNARDLGFLSAAKRYVPLRCKQRTFKKVDGTGWIPVNFNAISFRLSFRKPSCRPYQYLIKRRILYVYHQRNNL